MKRYIGGRIDELRLVLVNGKPLRHVVRHSPTGLEWGYGGSGPADLALSILTDCLGSETAERHYGDFQWEIVSTLGDDWVLTEKEIRDWLDNKIGVVNVQERKSPSGA